MIKNYPTHKKLAFLFFFLFSIAAFSQTTPLTFTNPANNGSALNTFTVPAGVTSIKVEAWGGGAAGKLASGGGGGAFAGINAITVIPGTTYTVTVGQGGTAPGGNGQASNFVSPTGTSLLVAAGAIGINGGVAGSTETIKYAGGNGGTSSGNGGAGGGGSAGAGGKGGVGGNTSNNDGGTAGGAGFSGFGSAGAAGGVGGDNNSNGSNGVSPGGGGGEAGKGRTHGRGGNGQVIISWITVSVASNPNTVCSGAIVNLTATATPSNPRGVLLAEGFNNPTNSWSTSNTSSGGTPGKAAWTLQLNDYFVLIKKNQAWNYLYTFNSNDASQFYLSNSDSQGPGGNTQTVLTSPVISTLGYSSLSLEFYHYYEPYSSSAKVEVSIDGTNWTSIETYTTTKIGSFSAFAKTTINLGAYLNVPSLQIRFNYTASYGYWWAIDNVIVSGNRTNYDYSWSASPSGTAGLPVGAGTPSTTNALITANPTATTTYTATASASSGDGLIGQSSTSVTVNPLPTVNVGAAMTAICQGSTSAVLGGSVGGGATGGTWTSSAGGTFSSNATTLNAIWSPPGSYSGTATLTLTTTGGSCGTTSASKTIVVTPLPTASGSITGTPTVCQSQNNVSYSVLAITNATSYTWAYSGTGATISGTTNSITINFAANATSGNLTVRGTNACGNGTVSTNYAITVNILPTAPTTTDAYICTGSSATLAASGAITGEIYSWYTAASGGSSVNSTNSYNTPAHTGTTEYWVAIVNSNGCESVRTKATAFVNVNNRWKGSVSINWNDKDNWCTGVPSIANNLDVLIPSAATTTYSPTLSTGDFGYVENILFESGSILKVDNNYLFVKKNLTLNGKIDLNNEAQLLQGTDIASNLDAASTGKIEIDQQGTSDNFKYNYWGSPVHKTGATYTIAGVLRDGTNRATINEFNLINFSTPYGHADGPVTSPIRLSTYWMYKYANLGNGYSDWTHVGKDGTLKAGEGFTMKGSNTDLLEQNYTFVGLPNNGDISLTISANNDYLIGNPYPSALDAKQFIRDNINVDVSVPNTVEGGNAGNRTINIIDGNLYFWDHFGGGNHLLKSYEGGYAIYNLSGGVFAVSNDILTKNTGATSGKMPQRFIPVAQGFFVSSLDGGSIQFKNSQRAFKKENASVSQFMKSAKISKASIETDEDTFPRIHLKYSSPKGYNRQLLVAFIENTTDGIDIGYDAINNETFAEDISWRTNNINFIIQAVSTLNDERILPLEVKVSTTGIIKISIDSAENIPENTDILIIDKTTSETHNISKKPFEISLAPGTYLDRFALTFKTQKLVAEDVKADLLIPASAQPIIDGIHVFMNNAMGELQIKNNSTEEIVSVALINAVGQTIKTWNSNFNIRTISLPISTATGVYLAQINTKTGKTVKKISVE